MKAAEIIKYFKKKNGIDVSIDYNGWTIHGTEKSRWWHLGIPYIDSYDNQECNYDIAVYSMDNAFEEISTFIDLFYDESKKACIM